MTDPRPVVALEISPLSERHFTGIANVTRMMARELLADDTVEAKFIMGRSEVPPAFIAELLALTGGDILWWLAGRLDSTPRFDGWLDRPIVGLYPSTKPHRRLFPFEALVVHDLTTVVTPQYHTPDTVAFWQRQLLPDIMSSDMLVAVSESTASDIRTYFPQARDIPCIVVPEAPCGAAVPPLPAGRRVAPYILVLGTLEPRKNVTVVFEMLAAHPELLERATFVFVGRWGWGAQVSDLMAAHGLGEAVRSGRILFTGFIGDEARDQLLAEALAVVYPSMYEGFGLPILEAMLHGTAVITTYSTSLPEVGGDLADYFDAQSPISLKKAVEVAIARWRTPAEDEARLRRRAWAKRFSWTRFYRRIRDGALALQTRA